MKICVYGAGSIGCYVGGRLAATGADVVLIGRERLGAQLADNGLTVTDWQGAKFHVETPRFDTTPDAASDADLVLVTVKSAATAETASTLAGLLKPGAVVISFQNGLRNAQVLRDGLPSATVLAGMVAFNVVNQGGGAFHGATEGGLEVQEDPSVSAFAEDFERAGIPLARHEDMAGVQAAKLLLNLNNAVNALCGLPLREQLSRKAYRRCLASAQREALAVFAASGIKPAKITPLPPHWIPRLLGTPDAVFARAAKRMLAIDPHARSSMWEDLEAGRVTEVDYINGEIVSLAAAHDRSAPVNQKLVELVHDAETGGRRDWPGEPLLAALRSATTRG